MSTPKPRIQGTLAAHAHLRTGVQLWYGPTPAASIAVTLEQAYEALGRGLDKLVWAWAPDVSEGRATARKESAILPRTLPPAPRLPSSVPPTNLGLRVRLR